MNEKNLTKLNFLAKTQPTEVTSFLNRGKLDISKSKGNSAKTFLFH